MMIIQHNRVRMNFLRITALLCFLYSSSSASAGGADSYLFVPDGANFLVYGRGTDTFLLTQTRMAQLKLDSDISHLASGKRIVTAADDPSGLAVSEKMNSMIEGMRRSALNDEDMVNFHRFAESVIAQDQEIMQRVRELIVQASSGILGPDDRDIIQGEITELTAQIDMNAKFSQLNKILVIPDLTAKGLGVDAIDVVHDPRGAFKMADRALTALSSKRVLQGVKSNTLRFRIEGKYFNIVNFEQSASRITDQDMAEGVSDLIRDSVLLKSKYGLIMRKK